MDEYAWNDNEGSFKVEVAREARTCDVGAQLLDGARRAVVVVGHHRASAEAFLGHFGPAYAGGPERLQCGVIEPDGQQIDEAETLVAGGKSGEAIGPAFGVAGACVAAVDAVAMQRTQRTIC